MNKTIFDLGTKLNSERGGNHLAAFIGYIINGGERGTEIAHALVNAECAAVEFVLTRCILKKIIPEGGETCKALEVVGTAKEWTKGKTGHEVLEHTFTVARRSLPSFPFNLRDMVLQPVQAARYFDPRWRQEHQKGADEGKILVGYAVRSGYELLNTKAPLFLAEIECGSKEGVHHAVAGLMHQQRLRDLVQKNTS